MTLDVEDPAVDSMLTLSTPMMPLRFSHTERGLGKKYWPWLQVSFKL